MEKKSICEKLEENIYLFDLGLEKDFFKKVQKTSSKRKLINVITLN